MEEILMFFKLNIGITSDAKNELFKARIQSTIDELASQGIAIDEYVPADQMLVADYAAWLHQKLETNEAVPMHIQARINRRKTKARCQNA